MAKDSRGIVPETGDLIAMPKGGFAPRCQAQSKRHKRQCTQPAARGTSVCSVHGAGTRKRVQDGTRGDPLLVNRKGPKTRDRTWREFEKTDPLFAERLALYRIEQDLALKHELLARLWAMADVLQQKVQALGNHGEIPPPLLGVLTAIRATMETVARLEGKLDDSSKITVNVVVAYIDRVVEIVLDCVPPERVAETLGRLKAIELVTAPAPEPEPEAEGG